MEAQTINQIDAGRSTTAAIGAAIVGTGGEQPSANR